MNDSPLSYALKYALRGWLVFPVYEWTGDKCACNKSACAHPAKHPRTIDGLTSATTNPEQITTWWTRWPSANIGLRTGPESGLWVLDVDKKNGGIESFEDLYSSTNLHSIPLLKADTGGGGFHVLFKFPQDNRYIKSLSNNISGYPGLDVKGNGGYIIVAPSLHASGKRYTFDKIDQPLTDAPVWLLDLVTAPKPKNVMLAPPQPEKGHAADEVRDSLLRFASKRYTEESKQASSRMVRKMLKGEAFAESGGRHDAVIKVLGVIAIIEPFTPPAILIKGLLSKSLETMGVSDRYEKFLAELNTFQSRERARITKQEEEDLSKQSSIISEATAGLNSGQRVEPYSIEELGEHAQKNGCTLESLPLRYIIQSPDGKYFYVMRGLEGYHRPVGSAALPQALKKYLRVFGIDTKDIDIKDLLRDFCTVALEVKGSFIIDTSVYNPVTETFTEALCPRRKLQPKYNAQVAEWLRFLGGKHHDKLLDWIATITRLDHQNCALVLIGKKAAGKGLLSEGLARIWTDGAPSALHQVLANFNDCITKCPLVIADEHFKGQKTTKEIRALIGQSTLKLNRKFMSVADVRLAVRVIVCANDNEVLSFKDEDQSLDALQATAERFLLIPVTSEPVKYLEHLCATGEGTANWVDGDMIAEHALHLIQTRSVTPGPRFLVQGNLDETTNILAKASPSSALVLEWLARYLDEVPGQVNLKSPKGILLREGEFFVNPSAIADSWGIFHKAPCPTVRRIGSTLTNLGYPERIMNHVRYKSVDIESLLAWAQENDVGTIEIMRKNSVISGVISSTDTDVN